MTLTGLKDKFDRDICVGNWVVYPVRRGAQTGLKAAKITGELNGTLTGTNESGYGVRLRVPNRCAIVEVE